VTFSQAPQPSQLAALRGVEGAQPLGEGRWRVTFADPNGIDALVGAAVQRGWGLRELSPERLTLERVFMDLVYHGQGAGQA
jgi:ABC-2 type transport system ATP-binding protein